MAFNHNKEKASINAVYNNAVKITEKALALEYKKGLDSIRLELAKTYEKYSVAGELTLAEMSQYNRLTNLNKAITAELSKLGVKTSNKIKTLTGDIYHESFFREGYIVNNLANININYGILSPEKIIAATENPLQYIGLKRNRAQVVLGIRAEITSSLIQGENYTKMARRVKKALEKNANNAMRIARTEAHRSQIKGELDSIDYAEEQGIIIKKIWLATIDLVTREDHANMDGQEADKDGNFHFPSGGVTQGPGQSGLAEQDIHCRCDIMEEVDEIRPQKRRLGKEGIGEYKNYDEWAKDNKVKQKVKIIEKPAVAIKKKLDVNYMTEKQADKLCSKGDAKAVLESRPKVDMPTRNQNQIKSVIEKWTGASGSRTRAYEMALRNNEVDKFYKQLATKTRFSESTIRSLYADKDTQTKQLRAFIYNAPKYRGSLVRGTGEVLNLKVGEKYNLDAMSSFSSGTKPIKPYNASKTILKVGKSNKGVDISRHSRFPEEREVLVPSGEYKVSRHETITAVYPDVGKVKQNIFYLEEI